jgi:hypothetical protein
MTVTFENDNDIIVYALEKIIAYARRTQQIFVAQCVWWLVSIIGLEQGLVNYIDNLQSRINVNIIPEKVPSVERNVSPIPRDNQEDPRQDKILKECEEYLKDSRRLREIAALKATGKTLTGFINPSAISKKKLRKKDRILRKSDQSKLRTLINKYQKTEGIQLSEINRRKSSGECLRCAWPSDRKGSHRVAECRRPIKLDKGTASFPKAKKYQKAKQATQEIPVKEESSESSSCEESSDEESSDDSL